MGPFTPVVIDGYKYVSKIIDDYTKWTVVDRQEQSSPVALTILSARRSYPSAAGSHVFAPTRAASTQGRSFGSIAWGPVLFKSSPPPTRRSKLVCPDVWGELCMVQCMLADSGFSLSMLGELFMAAA